MKRAIFSIAILLGLSLPNRVWAEPTVYRVHLDGPIGPTCAAFITRAIDEAQKADATCLVVEMDTPGGLDTAMRDIVKHILNADIPVVVFVSPAGSRAASAGAFILLSAHVAAMAPGTSVGAAHPVQLGAAIADSILASKVGNDAAAYMRSLAEKRGRPVEWAEKMVRESVSFTEREAHDLGLIDLVTPSLDSLCTAMHGLHVATPSGPHTLDTAHARVVAIQMGYREKLLVHITNPNVAYVLMMLGIYGLIFELSNPGSILPGVIGSICIILAFYAFQALPINFAGLLLVLFGVALLILEIKVPSYGLLTLGGLSALALGSTMLIETPNSFLRVSWHVIVPTLIFSAIFFLWAVGMGLRAQKRAVHHGSLIDQIGTARTQIDDDGILFINGEYWQAYADAPIENGTSVRVVALDGNRLKVRPI